MWHAYDQRWPLPDSWAETARMCRIVMCASGNYKSHDIPDESAFMPIAVRPEQTQQQIFSELMKLNTPIQG